MTALAIASGVTCVGLRERMEWIDAKDDACSDSERRYFYPELEMVQKWVLPSFLAKKMEQKSYSKWLHRKAVAHVGRDRARGNKDAKVAAYKAEIHRAVIASDGFDAYTGEMLNWKLMSCYDVSGN